MMCWLSAAMRINTNAISCSLPSSTHGISSKLGEASKHGAFGSAHTTQSASATVCATTARALFPCPRPCETHHAHLAHSDPPSAPWPRAATGSAAAVVIVVVAFFPLLSLLLFLLLMPFWQRDPSPHCRLAGWAPHWLGAFAPSCT